MTALSIWLAICKDSFVSLGFDSYKLVQLVAWNVSREHSEGHMRGRALLCLASIFFVVSAERTHGLFETQLLPANCTGGELPLSGKYKTVEVVKYPNNCTLIGDPGTEVEVSGEIHFLQNAKLQGSITFRGTGLSGHRCVDVEGSLEFVEPNVEFINCGSKDTEDGGGIKQTSDQC